MKRTALALISLAALASASSANAATAGQPMELTGTKGKFDFIKIDSPARRLLACHTGNGTLDVIDIDTGKVIRSVSTGAAQGVAIDEKRGRYFVSVSEPAKLVIIDSKTLAVTGEVPLPEPADLVAYHEGTNRIYVCDDENPKLWIIDPEARDIVSTLTFPAGGMEDLCFDATGKYLFQCLKDASQVAKVEVATGRIVATWSTVPGERPHGLSLIPTSGNLLVAGGAGKLCLLNASTGQVVSSADIAPRVDEMVYDANSQTAYCASGSGTISTATLRKDTLSVGLPIASAIGAHSIAFDAKMNALWIAYAKGAASFIQKFDVH